MTNSGQTDFPPAPLHPSFSYAKSSEALEAITVPVGTHMSCPCIRAEDAHKVKAWDAWFDYMSMEVDRGFVGCE